MADQEHDAPGKPEGERKRPPAITPENARNKTKPEALKRGDGKARDAKRPRGVVGPIRARDRPGAIALPQRTDVSALTPQPVVDKWTAEAAGLRAVATDDNVITMFDVIGEDFWGGGGITAKKVTAQLRAIGERPIEVQINSPGGDMFEGIAIYNVLREHPQNVTVKIMGMAASAASIIAMAGDTVEIGAASFLMIHNCWVVAIGNRHDFLETAAFLEPFDHAMADVYVARSGEDLASVQKWMDEETYMNGQSAIDRGFADTLLPADKIEKDDDAKAKAKEVNDLRAMELQLVSAGLTRSDARDRINRIKGTPGAAPEGDTPGAVDDQSWIGDLAGLRDLLRS